MLSRFVKKLEIVAYEDLGTEAIRRLEVDGFPAIVLNDCHGGDLYAGRAEAVRAGGPIAGGGRMARVIEWARPPIAAAHLRKDAWWALPVTVVLVLGGFVVYSTWAAFQNAHYYAAPYLSPFYSPCLSANCQHVTFAAALPGISCRSSGSSRRRS